MTARATVRPPRPESKMPMGRSLNDLPPDLALEIPLDLFRVGDVHTCGQVLPTTVGEQDDAHLRADRLDRAQCYVHGRTGRDAGEDAFALGKLTRHRKRIARRDHELPVDDARVEDRRDVALVQGAKALDEVSRGRLG